MKFASIQNLGTSLLPHDNMVLRYTPISKTHLHIWVSVLLVRVLDNRDCLCALRCKKSIPKKSEKIYISKCYMSGHLDPEIVLILPVASCYRNHEYPSICRSLGLHDFNLPSGLEETGDEGPVETAEAGPLDGGTARLSANQDEYFSV